uniref:Uncharacterized protein n=2 Tax=Cryptomonas curvata TaxID=233186 RepID=A0A7S0MQ97_9CRYP|mmetsp:Transcript_51581/g.107784  ORF Transcript_51581/g.107784 Transcript_51581/m.107784 type:complete len:525 (+) Transcript_51581:49-1623(+)
MWLQTQTRRALEAQILLHSADLQEVQHRHEVRLAAAQELSRAPVLIGAARFERIAEALAVLELQVLERLRRLVKQGTSSTEAATTVAAIQGDFAHARVEVTAGVEVREKRQPSANGLIQRRKSAVHNASRSCCGNSTGGESEEKWASGEDSDNGTWAEHGSQTDIASDFFLTQRAPGAGRGQPKPKQGQKMRRGSLVSKPVQPRAGISEVESAARTVMLHKLHAALDAIYEHLLQLSSTTKRRIASPGCPSLLNSVLCFLFTKCCIHGAAMAELEGLQQAVATLDSTDRRATVFGRLLGWAAPTLPSGALDLVLGLKAEALPLLGTETRWADNLAQNHGGRLRGNDAAASRPAEGVVSRACAMRWAGWAERVYGLDASGILMELDGVLMLNSQHGEVFEVCDVVLAVARKLTSRYAEIAKVLPELLVAVGNRNDAAKGKRDIGSLRHTSHFDVQVGPSSSSLSFEECQACLEAVTSSSEKLPDWRAASAYDRICSDVATGKASLAEAFARAALELEYELQVEKL